MIISFFSTQSYDREYFDRFNRRHEIRYFDASLNEQTVKLTSGSQAVCVFVNDKITEGVVQQLADNGVKLIALRSAGYNNVNLASAKARGITVVRVPAY